MYTLISKFNQIVGAYKEENNMRISFLFDPANTDYANFKKEILAGAELQDADGNVMTQEQADDFIKELP
jgi:hypothetical protein